MQTQTSVAAPTRYQAFKDKVHQSDWRVERVDIKSGDVFVAIFCGPLAQKRAEEYATFKNAQ